jgi:signal transduction histidine kinase
MLSGDMNIINQPTESVAQRLLGRRAAYAWTLALVLGFIILDLNLPLGVAAGVPYAVAVMTALRTSNIRFILAITLLGVILALFGLLMSPDGGETWKVIANRLLAVGVIVGSGFFSTYSVVQRRASNRQAIALEQVRRRRVQEANVHLVRSAEARSKFLGQISHELRTPLTSLTTFAHILDEKTETLSTDRIKSHAEVISRSARRLEVLIDDLFDASGTETGEFKLNLSTIDLPAVVANTINDYEHQVTIRDQELTVNIDVPSGTHFHALADPVRIAQVVTNLVSNASKYSWPGSVITVFCAFEDGRYIVKVTDHGDGIKAADLQKIFTPFFRADNEFVRSVPGAGLGLTISRSIIELHDGSISIESELNVGTTVMFTIPAFPNE